MISIVELLRYPGEEEQAYLWRTGQAKCSGELDVTWEQIAAYMNGEFRDSEDEFRTESAYRKQFTTAKQFYEVVFVKQLGGDAYLEQLREERQELYKVKTQVRDERNELNRKLREQARAGNLLEMVKDIMRGECTPPDLSPSPIINSETDIIVQLTDLHAGLKSKNFINTFNEKILQDRMKKYLDEISRIQKIHQSRRCYLVLGGDLINGLIHTTLRIDSTMNVIEQVKFVSILVGEFVRELRKMFSEIHLYSVVGNHSRLSPKKDDQLDGEELDSLVPFYVGLMFNGDSSVTVHENEMGNGIALLRPRGHLWYAVHGDKDTVENVVGKLTLITGVKPAGILLGHRHENAFVTKHGVKICQSGCVSGTDSYALNHRLSGTPEQIVIVTSDRKPVECIFDIQL